MDLQQLLLSFGAVADQRYDESRRSPGFTKEYIFPGGCLPSLGSITSAMAAASLLRVEHVENIGYHYFRTLRCWRSNLLQNHSKILGIGFDEEFIKKWEYYFDYCAAAFKSNCCHDYQEGDKSFTYEGTSKRCPLQVTMRVHNPRFYWKVMTRADIGLAEAYIDGDFSVVDKDEGLLNLILILIANRDAQRSVSKGNWFRVWWSPVQLMAGIASAALSVKHFLRANSLIQARKNVSDHYDLSNELFTLFLDETMTYSCAVFKGDDEDLKTAQMRKLSLLIKKARIEEKHEVLEIGCGWGSLGIEVVKQTGCKYTGITLAKEQLEVAERKAKEAGLQDRITFHLCDYRELSKTRKYDRILSCGMVEHVGHEYMEEFFSKCDSVLSEDGIFVLQFIAVADQRYDECRRSSDFIKEYIFPGGCLPSLSSIASAMAAASLLRVEHVENIGYHYFRTLRCWRSNFLQNHSKLLGIEFGEEFIKKWEYYFDYSSAAFKSNRCHDYQVVFSRPCNFVDYLSSM